jgi:hypothetical protein
MNLSDIREGELKELFDALEEAFHAKQIDFDLIGVGNVSKRFYN